MHPHSYMHPTHEHGPTHVLSLTMAPQRSPSRHSPAGAVQCQLLTPRTLSTSGSTPRASLHSCDSTSALQVQAAVADAAGSFSIWPSSACTEAAS